MMVGILYQSTDSNKNLNQILKYRYRLQYDDMPDAPPRERAALARSTITMKMDGLKK